MKGITKYLVSTLGQEQGQRDQKTANSYRAIERPNQQPELYDYMDRKQTAGII
ncbi:Photosystem II CP47 reaction center protein [Senna tora]|uniref:Photosystem II CP47 reaction center protein n=1 Tax=Senna tora TaxID=362788 RepID=A0A834SBY5_9FABA|nr:Photosystem II CP47 reaction center protein [Senna tora]